MTYLTFIFYICLIKCSQEPHEKCWEAPKEHCEYVTVKVAKRWCEQEEKKEKWGDKILKKGDKLGKKIWKKLEKLVKQDNYEK